MALQAGEPAPHGGGEEIPRDVFACHAAEDRLPLVLRGGLGAFELGFGLLHSRFERFELFGADALDADTDGGLLADQFITAQTLAPRTSTMCPHAAFLTQ